MGENEKPQFLYKRPGSILYYDFKKKTVVYTGFDTPPGYRFQATQWSAQFGKVKVYEKVSE